LTYKFILSLGLLLIFKCSWANDSLVVQNVVITGNKKTKEWVILRELNLKKGSLYLIQDTGKIISLNKKQILNSGLFNDANLRIEKEVLYVDVQEKWYFWPIPIIDIADRNFNQWWLTKDPKRLIYGTELKYENVRGRNERLFANLTLGYTKQADITYHIPVIKKRQNLGFIFHAAYLANKEVWFATDSNKVQFYNDVNEIGIRRAKASAGIIRRKGINQYQYYKLNWQQANIIDTIVQLNPEFLGNANKKLNIYSLNYNFIWDKRDIRGQPLSGNYYNISADVHYLDPTDQLVPVLNYRSSHFRPLGGKWFSSLGVHAKLSTPNNQPYRYNRAIGYDYNVVRGYEYYVVDGANSGVVKTNLKYALLLNKAYKFGFVPVETYKKANNSLFLLAFYDAGYADNPGVRKSNTFSNRLLHGYGVGVEWVVWYDRMVRFELSRNHLNELGFYVSFKMGV